MASSDDDIPLVNGRHINGRQNGFASKDHVTKNEDRAMDKEIPSHKGVDPGVSIRIGTLDEMDVDVQNAVTQNGGKRKSRISMNRNGYKEESTEDEDEPLNKRRRTSNKQKLESDSDDDDLPLVSKRAATKAAPSSPKAVKGRASKIPDDSDSDEPIKLVKEKAAIERRAEKEAKEIRKQEKTNGTVPAKATPTAKKVVKQEPADSASKGKRKSGAGGKFGKAKKGESSDDEPASNKRKKVNGVSKSTVTSTPIKKGAKGKQLKKEESEAPEDDEEEEEYRWWEDPTKGDGSKKWTTLEHNGVIFPPPYEPLPKSVKMKYDGVPLDLHPDAEEVAGFYGSMLNSTVNVENPTFNKNFFHDFREILENTGGAKDGSGNKVNVKEFTKCDFTPIFDYYESKRLEKKALPGAEKKRLKAEKDAAEAPYMYCTWDGRKEKVGNFRVEPPGLFRGRGEHPKTGFLKKRVMPEQITLNIGKDATVPKAPKGHRWKEVKHDNTGTWLAMWQENINGAYKYVMLAANSAIKGQSDYKKFEKARELKKHIDRIRKDYRRDLKAELMADRQRATAVYLIDQFALRAGNEKSEDEAETVGCCSLKFEHITLKPPNTVIFDFLGKDSIRFYDEVQVDPQVFKNLKIFKKAPKGEGDQIFDRLQTTQLNKHLATYMQGLSAKVFRTYNASYLMSCELQKMKSVGTIAEKVKDYNEVNRKVAILCNHKRTVNAGHAGQMEKMTDRIKGLKYQKWRIKQMMLDIDPKIKKKMGTQYFELDEDLDEEWIKQHQAFLVEEQKQKIEKKFQKDNDKRVGEGEKPLKDKELKDRLAAATELEKKFAKENKTKKVVAEGKGPTIEKMKENLNKLDERIKNMLLQAEDKESNKEVALGTSKINYIDPRLTVVFSKKFNVPIEKFFSKTLREKFDWAIKSVDENWTF